MTRASRRPAPRSRARRPGSCRRPSPYAEPSPSSRARSPRGLGLLPLRKGTPPRVGTSDPIVAVGASAISRRPCRRRHRLRHRRAHRSSRQRRERLRLRRRRIGRHRPRLQHSRRGLSRRALRPRHMRHRRCQHHLRRRGRSGSNPAHDPILLRRAASGRSATIVGHATRHSTVRVRPIRPARPGRRAPQGPPSRRRIGVIGSLNGASGRRTPVRQDRRRRSSVVTGRTRDSARSERRSSSEASGERCGQRRSPGSSAVPVSVSSSAR